MTTKLSITAKEVDVQPVQAVTIEGQCRTAEIGSIIGALFGRLAGFMAATGYRASGAPRVVYTGMDDDETSFVVAFPVDTGSGEHTDVDGIRFRQLPGGPTWRFTHTGPYPELGVTYDAITDWLRGQHLIQDESDWIDFMPMWEEYVNDPAMTAPENLVTYIYLPRSG